MKSVDFRNDPLFLRNQFPRDGTFEMPIIRKTKLSLDNLELIGYDRLSEEETEKVVHFFWTITNSKSSGKTRSRVLKS